MNTIRVPIEVDITYANRTWFSHKKTKRNDEKAYIIGFYQRSEPCQAAIHVLLDNKEETIKKAIAENVAQGSIIYCEANGLPNSTKEFFEVHEIPEGSHAVGDLHVNNVKTMWRQLKRNIKEEHIHVSLKYLQDYCNEVAWKTSNWHLSHQERFEKLIHMAATTVHLTQKQLVQKGEKSTTK